MTGAIADPGSHVFAFGHGPVFGMTTPTNGAGAWAFDLGFMGRAGDGDDGAMTRAMLAIQQQLRNTGGKRVVVEGLVPAPKDPKATQTIQVQSVKPETPD